MPSSAGSNSRIDFFLKEDGIGIEVKATRTDLDDHALGEEILSDMAKYKAHTGIKTLFFFVWDPEHVIRNPAGLKNDVKGEAGERSVHLIFSPPRQ